MKKNFGCYGKYCRNTGEFLVLMLSFKRFSKCKWELWLFIVIISLLVTLLWFFIFNYHYKNGQTMYNHPSSVKSSILQRQKSEGTVSLTGKFQFKDFIDETFSLNANAEVIKDAEHSPECSYLSKCFNFEKCRNGFSVYVYPSKNDEFISSMYSNILKAIKSNIYYTDDPDQACLYVLSLDTHDRDIISANFVKHMNTKVRNLKHWNNGENHLIIVFFSGTWPNYLDTLSFNFGKAIIARASSALESIRKDFDISIPLLPKDYPFTSSLSTIANDSGQSLPYLFPIRRKYLLSFKGKRYLYGIGSKTRNMLHLINNGKDLVFLTTCRHGNQWEKYKDERCDKDNENFDRFVKKYIYIYNNYYSMYDN